MDRSSALEAIQKSISKGTSSPFPGVVDREACVRKEAEKLVQLLIDPIKVNIASASYEEHGFKEFSRLETYAIVKSKDQYLLFQPESGLFALGWSNESGNITMLGFSSADAIAEWRG